MRPPIHRSSCAGFRPACGAPLPANVSMHGLGISCPKCIELSRVPTREEQLAAWKQTIAALQAAKS